MQIILWKGGGRECLALNDLNGLINWLPELSKFLPHSSTINVHVAFRLACQQPLANSYLSNLRDRKTHAALPNETSSSALCSWNKRLVWSNQDWHHWQQLQAACAVSTCVCVCLLVFTSVCARVCVCQDEVTWLLSWAVKEDPALCCQSSTNENHQRWSTVHPGWQNSESLCVSYMCHTTHTLKYTLPHPHCTLAHTYTGTPDHAKAHLEMKNDPSLAVHCCISSQL